MRIYISGPMRGYPQDNYPKFKEIQRRLIEHFGAQVDCIYNPAIEGERVREEMGLPKELSKASEELQSKYLRRVFYEDMTWINLTATHLCMIEEFRLSNGAKAEYYLGKALNKEFIFERELCTSTTKM